MSEKIKPISIEDKMKDAYLSYSLSVIVSRALPDVRDGLKPVHRRILYGCDQLGLSSDRPHKKSARLVGEVLGKFHPHGDNALYKTLVRMAQPFSQRYQLIDGHGNFGSIDGDNAAAMRYTEARLTPLSEEMLEDLDKDTVPFSDNFDGTLTEPDVLPAAFPNLLINGSSGIAVGMSTDIPPHNLREVIEGTKALMKDSDLEVEDLREYIPGPDFPTGGKIIGGEKIRKAYHTGSGSVVNRGSVHIERRNNGRQLVITEIPYQINKSKLVEEITKEVKKDNLDKISTVRDESDQEGLRVVLELKYDAEPEIVENRLYKYTSLQKRQRINMLALKDEQPEVMDLKEILKNFVTFRREVVRNRIENLLEDEEEKLEVLKGLRAALDDLDLIISLIRNSRSRQEASRALQKEFDITENQADAILSMRLERLVRMERDNIQENLQKTEAKIDRYRELLSSQEKLDELIISELDEIKDKYGDKRRTEIISDEEQAEIDKQDLIKSRSVVMSISARGRIKKTDSRKNIRAAKNDHVTQIMEMNSLDSLLFFTRGGYCYNLPVHEVADHHGLSTGDPLTKFLETAPEEEIIGKMSLNEEVRENYIATCTDQGRVKITAGSEYETSVSRIKAINLSGGDGVVSAFPLKTSSDLILISSRGRIIRFSAEEISISGRNTMGSWGIKLESDDSLQRALSLEDENNLVVSTPRGRMGRLKVAGLKRQNRYGKGGYLLPQKYSVQDAVLCGEDDTIVLVDKGEELYTVKAGELPEFKNIPINRTRSPLESLKPPVKKLFIKKETSGEDEE